jgi:ADP-heptose:LPS heptosyltransferase
MLGRNTGKGGPPIRIILFRPGALGDALLALPALALLQAAETRPHITLVARADVLPLARGAGVVDETYDYDLPCWSALWRARARLRSPAKEALLSADAAVAWCVDDGTVTRNLLACGIPRVIVTPGKEPADSAAAPPGWHPTHTALYLSRTLSTLLPGEPPVALRDLPSVAADLARAEDTAGADEALALVGAPPERIVTLHPGSGRAAKCWPAESFAAIARRLLAAGYAPLLLAGPADDAAIGGTLAALGADAARITVARDLALPALLGVLRRCAAYLGNDSGVSHLAGLAGTPTLALFGPTDPAIWAPVGPHVRVLRAPLRGAQRSTSGNERDMAHIRVERVWTTLQGLFGATAP